MILREQQGGVQIVTLDRPHKRNALSAGMLDELRGCLNDALAKSPRAILLRGSGDSFCSGFDLSACRDDPAVLGDLLTSLFSVISVIRGVPCPVVIAAQGAAIAGGCALLCGADFVVTNTEAKLGYPVVRLGISPAVTAPFLRATVGDARTRELLLEGALINGASAHACGLASHCVPTSMEVVPQALAIAQHLAEKPPLAMVATRRWLNELEDTSTAQARSGLNASLSIVGSDEQNERLAKLWAK
ncbi:MAG: enoyl-CoA hydratase/isomerase family protein [Pyrinomonadaceae bacterium]|nr:enoyl-CoA hydratase/isomerase family protein [Phycisphaerales bacterium]